MKLFLTRHGQTLSNTQGITMGHLDSPLTAAGKLQAREKGEMLSDVMIAAVYSSDLGRCRQTTGEIYRHIHGNPPVAFLETLREIDFGIYQGRPYSDVPMIEGGYMANSFPGGESNEVMAHRVITAVNEIYKKNKNENVLIVTHSGPISAILAAHSGTPLAEELERKTDNSSIIELELSRPLKYGQ